MGDLFDAGTQKGVLQLYIVCVWQFIKVSGLEVKQYLRFQKHFTVINDFKYYNSPPREVSSKTQEAWMKKQKKDTE